MTGQLLEQEGLEDFRGPGHFRDPLPSQLEFKGPDPRMGNRNPQIPVPRVERDVGVRPQMKEDEEIQLVTESDQSFSAVDLGGQTVRIEPFHGPSNLK